MVQRRFLLVAFTKLFTSFANDFVEFKIKFFELFFLQKILFSKCPRETRREKQLPQELEEDVDFLEHDRLRVHSMKLGRDEKPDFCVSRFSQSGA